MYDRAELQKDDGSKAKGKFSVTMKVWNYPFCIQASKKGNLFFGIVNSICCLTKFFSVIVIFICTRL